MQTEKFGLALKKSKFIIAILVATLIYISYASAYSIFQFLSLHAYVYDAGVFMQNVYNVTAVHWTWKELFIAFTVKGMDFFLSPFALLKSYYVFYVLQSAVIGLCAPVLFLISKEHFLQEKVAFMISLSYLLFFPLAGMNFYDLHEEAFFPFFLLLGYYLSLKGKTVSSVISYFISASSQYPLSLVIFLLAIVMLWEIMGERLPSIRDNRRSLLITYTAVAVISAALFFSRFLYFLFTSGFVTPPLLNFYGHTGPSINIIDIIITIVVMTGPFYFVPFFSKKSVLLVIGYFMNAWKTGLWFFSYPYGITAHYLYLLVPILYIGFIDSLFQQCTKWRKLFKFEESKLAGFLKGKSITQFKLVSGVVIMILILAFFFQPYGPLNGVISATNYNMSEDLKVNMTQFEDVEALVDLIPNGDPYVVIQNGIPEFFPRNLGALGYDAMIEQGFLDVPGTSSGILYNYTYQNQNGMWSPVRIDYVIADPYSSTYYSAKPGALSTYQLVRTLYGSNDYGLMAEINGMVILKRGYTGAPEYYVSFKTSLDLLNLTSSMRNGDTISINNVTTVKGEWFHIFKTEPISLSPGKYEVNVSVMYSSLYSNSGRIQIVPSMSDSTILNATVYTFSPAVIGKANELAIVHLFVNVTNFTDNFYIFSQITPKESWAGTLTFYNIHIMEISPP